MEEEATGKLALTGLATGSMPHEPNPARRFELHARRKPVASATHSRIWRRPYYPRAQYRAGPPARRPTARACRLPPRPRPTAKPHAVRRQRPRRSSSPGSRPPCRQVVVLNQARVPQTHPMIGPAAGADGVLFQPPPTGQRLPRVEDDGLRPSHGVDELPRQRGHTAQVHQKIEHRPLAGKQRPQRPVDGGDDGPSRQTRTVLDARRSTSPPGRASRTRVARQASRPARRRLGPRR